MEFRNCPECGSTIAQNTQVCPNCNYVFESSENDYKKSSNSNKPLLVLAVMLLLLAAIYIFRGNFVTSVVIEGDSVRYFAPGEKGTFIVRINPAFADTKDAKWYSSDNTIATVKDGVVTAKDEGTCIISVKTKNGKKASVECVVTSLKKNWKYDGIAIGGSQYSNSTIIGERYAATYEFRKDKVYIKINGIDKTIYGKWDYTGKTDEGYVVYTIETDDSVKYIATCSDDVMLLICSEELYFYFSE